MGLPSPNAKKVEWGSDEDLPVEGPGRSGSVRGKRTLGGSETSKAPIRRLTISDTTLMQRLLTLSPNATKIEPISDDEDWPDKDAGRPGLEIGKKTSYIIPTSSQLFPIPIYQSYMAHLKYIQVVLSGLAQPLLRASDLRCGTCSMVRITEQIKRLEDFVWVSISSEPTQIQRSRYELC